jgi:hypothetical protein
MVWSGNVLSLTEVLNIENIFQFAISGTCEYTRLLRSEPIFCVLRAVRKKGAGFRWKNGRRRRPIGKLVASVERNIPDRSGEILTDGK